MESDTGDVNNKNNNGKPIMSLAAQFDDLCRLTHAVHAFAFTDEDIIRLLKSVENARAKAVCFGVQAVQHLQRIRELESELKVKDSKLNNVRYALAKEISTRDRLQKERDALAKRLASVRQLLLEDPTGNTTITSIHAKERLMSCLGNLPKLETLPEVSCDSSEQSLSGIEYDRTEEDILGISRKSLGNRRSSLKKRPSSPMQMEESPPSKYNKRSRAELSLGAFEIIDSDECNANGNMLVTTSDDNGTNSDKQGSVSPIVLPHSKANRSLFKCDSEFEFKVPNKLPTVSTPTLPVFKGISSTSEEGSSPSKVARGHDFIAKYSFRPESCYVCKKSAGGLLAKNLLRCGNCSVCIHATCKEEVSFPCMPVVQKQFNAKRGSRLTTIADFVHPGQSPKIPALIYYCCKEIERRGLVEPGLYRVPGSEKDIVELKNKILRSKSGMPPLNTFDLNTLCGVVKKFLCSLDEPLVTRQLWRDFMEASQANDSFEKLEQMKTAVNDLPEVNRQTLAYLIVHLQKIADAPLCKMPRDNLSKVFAPTIVGQLHSHQGPNVPTLERMAVLEKQICVMRMLLESPVEFWKALLPDQQVQQQQQSKQTVTNGPVTDAQPCSSGQSSGDSGFGKSRGFVAPSSSSSSASGRSNDRRTSRAFPTGFVDTHGILTPSKKGHGPSNYFMARQKVNPVKPLF